MQSEEPTASALESLELVRLAQDGDREALERLLGRYYPRVRQIVRMRIGPELRGHLESGDILQETFGAAVRAFDRFEMRDEASLIHWLSKIAEHKIKGAVDYFTAQKRDERRTVPMAPGEGSSSDPGAGLEPRADGTPPLDELIHGEDERLVEACMDELRPEYREVILHHFHEGAPWARVAEWMGLSGPDAARMLNARAMLELARLVRRRRGPDGAD